MISSFDRRYEAKCVMRHVQDLISCMCIHDIQNEGWNRDMTEKFNLVKVIGSLTNVECFPIGAR